MQTYRTNPVKTSPSTKVLLQRTIFLAFFNNIARRLQSKKRKWAATRTAHTHSLSGQPILIHRQHQLPLQHACACVLQALWNYDAKL
jgi:hypothetical protein